VGKAIRFIRGFRPTWDDAYAAELMQKLGLTERDMILTASFGGRMKLALLLALAWRPQVLVLDEPTTGLDARARQVLFTELLAIVKDEERTVIISSHQITDLERFADRIGILHQGKLLVDGVTSELVERFVQVEFTGSSEVASHPGLTIQEQDGRRFRGVLDTQVLPLAELGRRGATDLDHQPQTLEELFLALTR
jgi:ABC-2 type transport system ATP-binding protein